MGGDAALLIVAAAMVLVKIANYFDFCVFFMCSFDQFLALEGSSAAVVFGRAAVCGEACGGIGFVLVFRVCCGREV